MTRNSNQTTRRSPPGGGGGGAWTAGHETRHSAQGRNVREKIPHGETSCTGDILPLPPQKLYNFTTNTLNRPAFPRGPPRRVSAYEISKSTGFHVDFRISKWISTFWILFEEPLFVILKILLINKPSLHTEYNVTGTLQFTATHCVLAHSLSQAPPSFWSGPGHKATHTA